MFKVDLYYYNYIDDDNGSWEKVYSINIGNPLYPAHNTIKLGSHYTGIRFEITAPTTGAATAGQVNISNLNITHSVEDHKIDLP